MKPNLLMLSGDASVARGEDGTFAEMLRRFSAYWARIDVLVPRTPGGAARQLGDNVFIHPSPWPRAAQPLFIVRQAWALLRQRSYSLVLSHDFGIFYNGIGALLLGRPYVSEIHHVEGYPRAVTTRERIYRALASVYVRAVRRRVLAFRVVNAHEVPVLLRRWGVPDAKIRFWPSIFIDFERFRPLGLPHGDEILFVGRLEANKGLFALLDAFAQVAAAHPTARLRIHGRGTLEAALRQRAAALGDRVTFTTERLPVEAMSRLYNEAAMLVCASTAEGGPRVTVEAMACGCAVVTTSVGRMADLARDGENALVYDGSAGALAACIRRLLDDGALRERIAAAGRASVADMTADAVIRTYAEGCLSLAKAE